MNIVQFVVLEFVCLAMIFGGVFNVVFASLKSNKIEEETMNIRISLAVSFMVVGLCLLCIAIQNPFAYLVI